MEKRVYSAVSVGLLHKIIKCNIEKNIKYEKNNNYYIPDDACHYYVASTVVKIDNKDYMCNKSNFTAIIYFSLINNSIMLNMIISGKSYDLLTKKDEHILIYTTFGKKVQTKETKIVHSDYSWSCFLSKSN